MVSFEVGRNRYSRMYRIGIVQTEEELRQVLNLRFRVFTEEQGRNSLADFDAKTYGDNSDVSLPAAKELEHGGATFEDVSLFVDQCVVEASGSAD